MQDIYLNGPVLREQKITDFLPPDILLYDHGGMPVKIFGFAL